MGDSPSSLVALEIPFGYTVASLLSLYSVEIESFLSIERLSFITLLGSLITSFVVAYRPIDRHLFPLLAKRFFHSRNWLYSLRSSKDSPRHAYPRNEAINICGYAQQALDSKPIDRPKGKIRSIIFLTIIVGITALIFLVYPPNLLVKSISFETREVVGILLLLTCILLFVPLKQEIRGLRLKLYLESLYLLGAHGVIDFGSNFNKLEEALNKNDWPAAENWAQRWYLEGKFYPKWPSNREISEADLERFFEEMQGKYQKRQHRSSKSTC